VGRGPSVLGRLKLRRDPDGGDPLRIDVRVGNRRAADRVARGCPSATDEPIREQGGEDAPSRRHTETQSIPARLLPEELSRHRIPPRVVHPHAGGRYLVDERRRIRFAFGRRPPNNLSGEFHVGRHRGSSVNYFPRSSPRISRDSKMKPTSHTAMAETYGIPIRRLPPLSESRDCCSRRV